MHKQPAFLATVTHGMMVACPGSMFQQAEYTHGHFSWPTLPNAMHAHEYNTPRLLQGLTSTLCSMQACLCKRKIPTALG